jgi:integrase
MSVYPGRTPGTWRVVIRFKGGTDEKIIEGKKSEATQYEAQRRIELQQESIPIQRGAKFSLVGDEYAEWAPNHLKDSTWRKVRRYQLATLVVFFGSTKVNELSVKLVDKYQSWRIKAGAGVTSINNELRVFRAVLNWARERGHPIPPLKWKQLPVRGKGRARAWTTDEILAIYAACQKEAPHLLGLLIFLMNTGCRKGEGMAAEWSWVDFEADLIRIPSTKFWQPKNGLPREVTLSSALREHLESIPQEERHPRVLFPSSDGRQYIDWPKDLFWDILEEAKVTGHPHMFRHSYASHFLKNQPDMGLLAQILGHSSTRMTEIYSHMLPGRLDRAMNAVNLGPKTVAETVAEAAE